MVVTSLEIDPLLYKHITTSGFEMQQKVPIAFSGLGSAKIQLVEIFDQLNFCKHYNTDIVYFGIIYEYVQKSTIGANSCYN